MYFVQDEYGDFIPVAMPQQRRRGGFWAGVANFFITILAIVLIAGLGYVFYSSIRPPAPTITTVPTAAVRTRVVAPAPALVPDAPAPGTFETLPAPASVEIAPVEAAPIIQAPALETPPEIEAIPQYIEPEQVSNDIPSDWQQNVFGDPAPVEAESVMSEVTLPVPEGGVAPEEVSSGIDPNWRCNVFGECGGGQ